MEQTDLGITHLACFYIVFYDEIAFVAELEKGMYASCTDSQLGYVG